MDKSILVVGAGKEGKGNIGEIFWESGWKVSFLDKDPKVIDALNRGGYQLTKYEVDGTTTQQVSGYAAYLVDDAYSCLPALMEADIIALALYPDDIPEAGKYLAKGLAARAQKAPGKKLSIISGTNKNHIMDMVRRSFTDNLGSDEARSWFDENVVLRDMIIRRSVDAKSNADTNLSATVTCTQLVQTPLNIDTGEVKWLEWKDNLEQFKEIKLYTINGPHATCAYAGWQKGYTTIPQAESDPEIAQLVKDVLAEAVQGLAPEFGLPAEEIWEFCTLPSPKQEMADLIVRVALDPIRKLARQDRLTGNALFCLKHGVEPDAILRSIANGMAYAAESDAAAMTIQGYIRDMGIIKATAKVCGLPEEHLIVQRVAENYGKLKH